MHSFDWLQNHLAVMLHQLETENCPGFTQVDAHSLIGRDHFLITGYGQTLLAMGKPQIGKSHYRWFCVIQTLSSQPVIAFRRACGLPAGFLIASLAATVRSKAAWISEAVDAELGSELRAA
jgi:hypothetical protein